MTTDKVREIVESCRERSKGTAVEFAYEAVYATIVDLLARAEAAESEAKELASEVRTLTDELIDAKCDLANMTEIYERDHYE